MRTRFPVLSTLLAALALLLILAACGGDGDGNDDGNDSATDTGATATSADTTGNTAGDATATVADASSTAATPTGGTTATASATAETAASPTLTATEPAASASPTGASSVAVDPVTVTSCGIDVTHTYIPQRAIAVDTGALEVLLALGLDDHIAGYFGSAENLLPEDQARVEAAGIPNLGASFPYPSLEVVLGEEPDFVFAYGFDTEVGFTGETLTEANVPFYAFEESCPGFSGEVNFDTLFQNIRDIGTIFRVEDAADALMADYAARLEAAAQQVPEMEAPARMFLMDFGDDPIFTAATGSLPSAMMRYAGGTNIFDDTQGDTGGVWYYATLEEIVARDPEVFVIVVYGTQAEREALLAERIAYIESHPALSVTTAAQQQRYVSVVYQEVVPSTQSVNAVERMVADLWGAE